MCEDDTLEPEATRAEQEHHEGDEVRERWPGRVGREWKAWKQREKLKIVVRSSEELMT